MLLRISAAAILTATTATAQGIEIRSADFSVSYKNGETASFLPLDGRRVALSVDAGFADNLGIDVELAYMRDRPPYEFDGYEVLLNPYWDVSTDLRLGVFWDMTEQNFGASERASELYGLTAVYSVSDQLVLDGYAGMGKEDFMDLDTFVLGMAANYSLGNGWAFGANADYQEIDTGGSSIDVSRVGLAASYTFMGGNSGIPLTTTFKYDYESQPGAGGNSGVFGLSLSIPLGANHKAPRPAKTRRGIHVDRPLT